jgi:hypothetical protein
MPIYSSSVSHLNHHAPTLPSPSSQSNNASTRRLPINRDPHPLLALNLGTKNLLLVPTLLHKHNDKYSLNRSLRLLQHLLTTSTPAETRYVPPLTRLLQYSGLCNSSTDLQILVLSTSRYIATLVAQGHLGKDGELDAREIGIEIDVYEDGSHTVRLSVDEGIVERKGEGRPQEYARTLRYWAGMNRVVVSTGDEDEGVGIEMR